MRQTAWALDILAELGLLYDSSIYPVRHDRYGVPDAPRGPFLARGPSVRSWSFRRRPCGSGGSISRSAEAGISGCCPCPVMKRALLALASRPRLRRDVLYFHPWEFDPDQPRLPLGRLESVPDLRRHPAQPRPSLPAVVRPARFSARSTWPASLGRAAGGTGSFPSDALMPEDRRRSRAFEDGIVRGRIDVMKQRDVRTKRIATFDGRTGDDHTVHST